MDASSKSMFWRKASTIISTVPQFLKEDMDLKPDTTNTSKFDTKQGYCRFFQIYFNFAYYLGFSPFRFVRDEDGKFIIKRWWPQQVICGVTNLLCIIRLITEARFGFRDLGIKTKIGAVGYFEIVMNFMSLAYKTVTMKRFWCNQDQYLHVLRTINEKFESSTIVNKNQLKIVDAKILYCLYGVFAIQSFVSIIAGKNFVQDISNWTPELWLAQLIDLARYTFFVGETSQSKPTTNSTHIQVPIEDEILAGVMAIGMLQRFIQGFFCDLCVISCALTLWTPTYCFAKGIMDKKHIHVSADAAVNESRMEESWHNIFSQYKALQSLSYCINMAMGNQLTWYIFESLIYYSLNLNAVLTTNNNFKRVDMIFFYVLTLGIFIISADTCHQLETIKTWISFGNNRHKIPAEDLNLVLHEMIAKDIGIRGSNTFTITYSFLAVILSTIVTFFIISVQSDDKDGTDTSYLTFGKPKVS